MRYTMLAIGLCFCFSAQSFGQQAAVGARTDAKGAQVNRGGPEPVAPNGTGRGVGGDMQQVLGVKPLTGAGAATQGVGANTPGFGNQISGYGLGAKGYKGVDCSPTAYPRSPFCPAYNGPAR